jgi:hypothetical protein
MSLHNLNTPNKQWNMYLNTLSSISGDDLTIKPDNRRNLLLEVSGNNNIFIKKGDISYNLTNYIAGDASFSNVDISVNLNPLRTNNSNLGLPSKLWGNAYIRDISVTNISVSGNMTISGISNVIQIIPRLANDISSSIGSATNIWQRAFIRDLSSISTINGTNWPITAGAPGPTGAIGPAGTTTTATWRDISNLTLTTYHRIYQEISGDISWSAVNGYYGLAKDAYPSLNPSSSGVKALAFWTMRYNNSERNFRNIVWSPKLKMFLTFSDGAYNGSGAAYSYDGINWINIFSGYALLWNVRCLCWSEELGIFVAASYRSPYVIYSYNGIDWYSNTTRDSYISFSSICWSRELGIFVAVGEDIYATYKACTSRNGINWIGATTTIDQFKKWGCVCWAPELSLFVATGVEYQDSNTKVMISYDGYNWTLITVPTEAEYPSWVSVCWSPQLGIFVTVALNGGGLTANIMTSTNGIDWIIRGNKNFVDYRSVCWCADLGVFLITQTRGGGTYLYSRNGIVWIEYENILENGEFSAFNAYNVIRSPELRIFVAVGINKIWTSSLKGRPPTSYNVFDNSFNRINENGTWDFSNINVTYLTVNNVSVNSDDRLKHNEVAITNGLNIIDRLTPKFYQKTQDLLEANYNGDLSNHAWTYEAGLIAQEVLQISDLSFVVGGGDYYEQKYNLITQTQDVSSNYYDSSANNYELSNNYYDQSANNYEVSYNLITQAYNLNYNSVFVYGLAAIKELHTKVKAQESTILNQKNIISSLLARIQALEK